MDPLFNVLPREPPTKLCFQSKDEDENATPRSSMLYQTDDDDDDDDDDDEVSEHIVEGGDDS